MIISSISQRKRTHEIELNIQTLEKESESEETISDFVQNVLESASQRQQLLMLQSERRSGILFKIGVTLMTISVFAPLILLGAYITIDPFSSLLQLQSLGVETKDLANHLQRDWHLLASGVAFGLLFLAAARGLLAQEAKQRATYFRVSESITFYKDLIGGLRIARRCDKKGDNELSKIVLQRILQALLQTKASEEGQGKPGTDGEDKVSPIDSELLRALGSLLKGS
jgi:hypothetical protein